MNDAVAVTIDHEAVANEAKHWVRLTAACNSKCVFCLDAEAQDGRFMAFDDICTEVRRGRDDKHATRLVVSGGEATIHPRFHDVVRFGKEAGYRWVQTVTNGQRLADRDFFLRAVEAGLDEITFSLHGHTPELHDRLTKTKNGFENLMRAMIRAVRDGRVIVNVDVCINKQNVEHLEAIVALCSRVGVREFDLLHIIPQGVAFEHRDELFYDVDAHAESLRRVFRLARHPGFHVWTNRFPVSHLEGMEELIQDPHKMLDEVGGRRVQFRRYLDEGTPIDCRDKERCPHCFIEPFCTALDTHVRAHREGKIDVIDVGERWDMAHLADGARWLGGRGRPPRLDRPLYLSAGDANGIELPPGSRVVATRPEHLDLPGDVEIEVHPDRELAAWLAEHPGAITARHVIHGTTFAKASEAAAHEPDWAALFRALPPGTRAQNLPACLCPGARIEPAPRLIHLDTYHEQGELGIDAFVDRYIESMYRAKSLRCRACPATDRCEGAHIQSIRARGFAQLQPLSGDWAREAVSQLVALGPRLREGSSPEAPAPRLAVPGAPPVPFIDTDAGRRS